jgi:hypothetical protein
VTDIDSTLAAGDALAAAGATAPRVSLADIEGAIACEYTLTGAEIAEKFGLPAHPSLAILTVTTLVLQNGWVVLGKSAPASPDNFDAAKGRTFAREDAVRQIWPLMGFALKDRLARGEATEGQGQSASAASQGYGSNLQAKETDQATRVMWRREEALDKAIRAGGDTNKILVAAEKFFDFVSATAKPAFPTPAFPIPDGMTRYAGTKTIYARPMNRGDYNALRGWSVPFGEDAADEGYLVEYTDSTRSNVEGFEGYISWSPKDVFEAAYTEV